MSHVLWIISVFIFDPFLSFFFFFLATLTPPSLSRSTQWVASLTKPGSLRVFECSVKLSCVYCVMKPPPRRPTVFAEQNESEEEKQFRKVFQQLAGDVSAVRTLPSTFWQFSCMFSCCSCLRSCHIFESFSCRTWKWAQLSWGTSSTKSSQGVGCFYAFPICHFFFCVSSWDKWLCTSGSLLQWLHKITPQRASGAFKMPLKVEISQQNHWNHRSSSPATPLWWRRKSPRQNLWLLCCHLPDTDQ